MIRRFLKTNNHKTNLRRFFSMSPDPKFFLLRFRIKSEEEKPRPGKELAWVDRLKFPFRKHSEDDGRAIRSFEAVRGKENSPDRGKEHDRE